MRFTSIKIAALLIFLLPGLAWSAHFAPELKGYILLQVERHGEAWYVYPPTGQRYFLNRPADAFALMKKLGLGAQHDFIEQTENFPARLSGLILLDAEKNGEAYYIYPKDSKKYYLGRPADAFRIMSNLGLGIADADLVDIPLADISSADPPPPAPASGEKILEEVPFASQAPLGGWADERQQNGCEEAAVLMAVKWARGEKLTKEQALKEILAASDYTQNKYGEHRDTSPEDTLKWLINDYYNYENAFIIKNISLDEIISQLEEGNIIVAPMNGQFLHNPNFTSPGPPNHMLVIRGYDPIKKVFITNDPGTRKGELYQYDIKVLYEAIRDYPTGYHELIKKIEKDVIIVTK